MTDATPPADLPTPPADHADDPLIIESPTPSPPPQKAGRKRGRGGRVARGRPPKRAKTATRASKNDDAPSTLDVSLPMTINEAVDEESANSVDELALEADTEPSRSFEQPAVPEEILVNDTDVANDKTQREPSDTNALAAVDTPQTLKSGKLRSSKRSSARTKTAQKRETASPLPPQQKITEALSPQPTSSQNAATPAKQTPRSSARQRKVPAAYAKDSDDSVKAVASSKQPSNPVAKKKQPLRGNWSADHLLHNAQSKLKDIDLEKLLLHPKAWTALSREEQEELVAMLPGASLPDMPDGEEYPNVAAAYIKERYSFRSNIRIFQEDLSAGHYEVKWLEDAVAASKKRAAGRFDSWKEKNMESFWGQKQRTVATAVAGDSAQYTVQDLAKAGLFEVGDVWLMQRSCRVGNGNTVIYVEKEATISVINDDYTLDFTFPPGQYKHSSPAHGHDVIIANIANPNFLAKQMTAEDGRIPKSHRAANTWREIRCIRKNQDMGALWDIRELYHVRSSA